MEYHSCKKLHLADTLKIPRAAIQYANQDQIKSYNINRMKRSTAFDYPSNVEEDFAIFSNDLEISKLDDRRSDRHSTFSGGNRPNLTVANLARLNQIHKNTPIKNIQPSMTNTDITITVDSMKTANNKPKENDLTSNASSTHFTMVNGFGGSRNKQPMKPICCCNNITTLITIMTIMFMIIIFGVIIFAEYPRMMAEIE